MADTTAASNTPARGRIPGWLWVVLAAAIVVFLFWFFRRKAKAGVEWEMHPIELTSSRTVSGLPTTLTVHGGPLQPLARWVALSFTEGFLQLDPNAALTPGQPLIAPNLFVLPMADASWTVMSPPGFAAMPTLYARAFVQDPDNAEFPGDAWSSNTLALDWITVGDVQVSAPLVDDSLSGGIQVTFTEDAGVTRWGEPVTFGVPIALADGLTDLEDLELVTDAGLPLPVDFTVATRWGNLFDSSAPVQWLHAHTRVTVGPDATTHAVLRRRSGAIDPVDHLYSPVSLSQIEDLLVVETGAARFEIDLAEFDGFEDVYVDRNVSGSFSSDEKVASSIPSSGAWITDSLGVEYSSRYFPSTLTVEQHGMGFTRIAIEGEHHAKFGGIGRDFLRTTTRMTFVHGSSDVRVRHTVRNDYLASPLGPVAFDAYRLEWGPVGLDTVTASIGGENVAEGGDGSVHSEVLATSQGIRIYQDSSGGTKYPDDQGHDEKRKEMQAGWITFQGYRRNHTSDGTVGGLIDSGLHAEGFVAAGTATGSLVVAMRDFWESYPKALEVDANGASTVEIWPAEWGGVHWIDDATQKTTDILLAYSGNPLAPGADRAKWLVAEHPLLAVLDRPYVAATGAWADLGDLPMAPVVETANIDATAADYAAALYKARDLTDDWGWWVFGESWYTMWSQRHGTNRNKLSFFNTWLQTGHRTYWDRAADFARHSMDVRPFHLEGFYATDWPFPNQGGPYLYYGTPFNLPDTLYADSKNESFGRYDLYDLGTYEEHRSAIPVKLTGGGKSKHGDLSPGAKDIIPQTHGYVSGFDYQHFVVDDMYEYWLLSGDPIAIDALEHVAQALMTWHYTNEPSGVTGTPAWQESPYTYEQGIPHGNYDLTAARGMGWTLRGLIQCYKVTGDFLLLDGMAQLVESMEMNRGPYEVTGLAEDGWLVDQRFIGNKKFDIDGDGIFDAQMDHEVPWQMGSALMGLAAYRNLLAFVDAPPDGEILKIDNMLVAAGDFLVDAAWQPSTQDPPDMNAKGYFPGAVHVSTKGDELAASGDNSGCDSEEIYHSRPDIFSLPWTNSKQEVDWNSAIPLGYQTVSGLAAVARITGDSKYLEPGLTILSHAQQKGTFSINDFKNWHWWNTYLTVSASFGMVDPATGSLLVAPQ